MSETSAAPFTAEPQPMETAPDDGTVIEVLFDGDWIPAHWSSRAWDGSPYGCAAFADEAEGLALIDLEAWRELEEPRFVDEYAEGVARMEALEADELARKKALARQNRRPRRTKAQMAEARARQAEAPARTAQAISTFMSGFRF